MRNLCMYVCFNVLGTTVLLHTGCLVGHAMPLCIVRGCAHTEIARRTKCSSTGALTPHMGLSLRSLVESTNMLVARCHTARAVSCRKGFSMAVSFCKGGLTLQGLFNGCLVLQGLSHFATAPCKGRMQQSIQSMQSVPPRPRLTSRAGESRPPNRMMVPTAKA